MSVDIGRTQIIGAARAANHPPIEWQYDGHEFAASGHEFAASVDQEVDERLRVEGTTTQ